VENHVDHLVGSRWADGHPQYSRITTIRPPNSYSVVRWEGASGMICASSRHQGGAHILMADGAVVFITDSIEAGDQSHVAPGRANPGTGTNADYMAGRESPYGLWGALGTKSGKETIEEQLNQ
jgi:prepilin-type processing-associated H-X9-DG protein